jgi:NADH-quinone oxidoreductase subunit L
LRRLLAGKYFIDELYEAVLGRPLQWVSQRVFLQFGDRALIDGTLHALAGIARGTAATLGVVQGGSLHRYALLVVLGVFAAIAWSVRHA